MFNVYQLSGRKGCGLQDRKGFPQKENVRAKLLAWNFAEAKTQTMRICYMFHDAHLAQFVYLPTHPDLCGIPFKIRNLREPIFRFGWKP